MTIKIGVQLAPQHCSFAQLAQAWQQADDLGCDSLWNWDHFFPLSENADGTHFEAWTSLAYLGALTRRAQVGCLVSCVTYRNPDLLADMANTLSHAMNGRLILGLGAGWFQRDYAEYGYEFATAPERLRRLERDIMLIKRRWEKIQPPPPGGSIPILVGGGGEKVTLRIAAQYADLWHSFGGQEEWAHKNRVLTEWCERSGRNPAEIERTAVVRPPYEPDTLDKFVRAGASHLIAYLEAPFDPSGLRPLLAWRSSRGED